ncbi:aminodeoxychorismate synthase component I [Caldinitratiruptor microaerophilus]|uniref:aminodeoxychorismate synthase n=1 Tax=Caldinitratiruptor microaerophilus TaxID=671077 RepID=A0AA35CJV9_9FIRM|nr:aminodeoxychorismate synthase component I [Caldinitratiruptor microaerophilus]BDG60457.1 aminodeoxychorismate synthase, component I [Caldinitratiruptor microaerophilus]
MTDLIFLPVPLPPTPEAALDALPEGPGRVLLESAGGPPDICRHSFVAAAPFAILRGRGQRYTLATARRSRRIAGHPFRIVESLLAELAGDPGHRSCGLAPPLAAVAPGEPVPPFAGGAIGYLAYDLGRQVERIPVQARDDLGLPELWLAWYDAVLVVDHVRREAAVVARPVPGRPGAAVRAARHLRDRIERAAAAGWPQAGRPAPRSGEVSPGPPASGVATPCVRSTFTRAGFEAAVRRAREYIAAGDIFQVNLAQRFSAPWAAGARALYRRLRAVNPAPFSAYLDCGDLAVVSASPERFLRVDPATRRVETRPIKGTRRRSPVPAEDQRLAAELLASEKDRAELVMIVDLERNDLGRVCEYGSVRVPDLRRLEGYPTVWHTVATVEGRLLPGAGPAALLAATFPGGSITGAPKVRAMEIIEELEPVRRGVYTGAIGWFGWDGALDLNIAIRTFTVVRGEAHFHAGGGIVADSDPAAEYEETLAKALGLLRALSATGPAGSEVGGDEPVRLAE